MAGNVKLSENQIKRLISHREPFLLLGQAVTNDVGDVVRVVSRQKLPHALNNRMHLVEGLGQATALLIRQVWLFWSAHGVHTLTALNRC